ncbi:hypothetical protein GWN42_31075, partial [candidate division KSB1 bacterium]|nr:hypothetical protein [candidate division KSB1 bacterium]NIR73092.1 hypothetical protein [candidate division KSB1 bacterium]NIS25203.1 hypothetical protein [candidate division KSB1 bacterium]NIU25917.1 hypothetical protein [candidate division KSB1 bacterium]NIU92696.1 hypothetical protein [candidate division KSB1 bacterium]
MFSLLILTSLGCDLQFQDTTTTVFDGQPVQLTKDGSRKSDPTWSPDGSLIAYSALGNGTNLLRMSLEGEDLDKVGRVEDGIGDSKFDISLDGGFRIVYQSTLRGHLWVTDLQGGSEFKLTPNRPAAREPDWSPNGQEVAFSAPGSGSLNIYVIPASGGTATQVTNQDGQDTNPTWSPDGNRIAFQSQRDGNSRIWIADLEADTLIHFTPDSVESGSPDWSPDGSKIAYQASRNDTTAIWITSLADSISKKLTDHTGLAINPAWSPDGTKIAYRSSNGIEISSLDGDVLFQIDTNQSFPTWLPDGNSLVKLDHVSYANIRLFSLSDSLIIPVTQPVDRQFDLSPAWYPDSRKLVFVRRNPELFSGQTLWTKSILGGEARPLIGEPNRDGIEFDPAVSPDGKWLVY